MSLDARTKQSIDQKLITKMKMPRISRRQFFKASAFGAGRGLALGPLAAGDCIG
jgi:hypothetical protein